MAARAPAKALARTPVPQIYHSFEGNKNGKCTILYSDGIHSAYIGECINKYPHGKGKILLANTSIYEGEFKHGRPCGPGSLTIDKVTFTCSTFNDMVPNGKCAVTYPNKTKKMHEIHSQAEVNALVREFGIRVPPVFKVLLQSITNDIEELPLNLPPISATTAPANTGSRSRSRSQSRSRSRSRSQSKNSSTRRKLHSWNSKPYFKQFNL